MSESNLGHVKNMEEDLQLMNSVSTVHEKEKGMQGIVQAMSFGGNKSIG